MSIRVSTTHHAQLLDWYQSVKRDLPWRKMSNPYFIWISEVMLQQTTVAAVVPFFDRFIKKFPTVSALARAPESAVLQAWTGLGYYSRARNVHKSAQNLAVNGFPQDFEALLQLPGFGPYTAAAVSSIAFNQPIGVLDGNVIRVLCRFYGLNIPWWKTEFKKNLQALSTQFAKIGNPSQINQALMELGATICTPQKTFCVSCPWMKSCKAFREDTVSTLPQSKPRKKMEIWLWEPQVFTKKSMVALLANDYAPFLKGQPLFPGQVRKLKVKPKTFALKHTITHHQIYVQPKPKAFSEKAPKNVVWVEIKNMAHTNPSILLKKVIKEVLR